MSFYVFIRYLRLIRGNFEQIILKRLKYYRYIVILTAPRVTTSSGTPIVLWTFSLASSRPQESRRRTKSRLWQTKPSSDKVGAAGLKVAEATCLSA
jgi:hypothetical protein